MDKNPAQSWTIWFNVIMGVATVLGQTVLPAVAGVLSPGAAAIVTAIGNVLLRFKTTQPISFRT